jgi:LPXTG-motif cell wall-anchored protein
MVAALGLTTSVAQAQTYPGTSVPTSSTSSTSTTVTGPTTPTTPTIPNPVTTTVISIPGAPCVLTVGANNFLLPGATLTITVTCTGGFNTIFGGTFYSGVGASTPFALPSTAASGGAVSFKVTLPSDFQLNATHGVTIRNDSTGATAGSGTFFVDKNGRIGGSSSTGTGLPKTGTNHIGDLVKAGGALVALGGVVLLATKRRKAAPTA